VGEGEDAIEWGLARDQRAQLMAEIEDTLTTYDVSDRALTDYARVSHHTLAALRKGSRVASQSLLNLAMAADALRLEKTAGQDEASRWLKFARGEKDRVGSGNKLADLLGVSRPYMSLVLKGSKPLTRRMIERLRLLTSAKSA
jgi:hypothetical protein